uniref:Uncharacterized protein n=1 Tax=Sus scrofa TaxID=9823 RepID=A0A8D0RQ24_PIG
MFAILSYLFVQFLVDPMQLRTDPHFAGISRDTWLLFLPFLPVRAKAPVLLLIGLLVLVIIMVGLLLLGHLFFFHLYLIKKKLSTYEYITQGRQQLQLNSSHGRRDSDSQKRPSQDAGHRRSSVRREKHVGLLPPSQEPGSLSGVAPEAVAVPKGPVVILMPPLHSLTSTDLTSPAPSLDLTLSAPCPDMASTITLLPESISSALCPDKASTITLLSESILSAPYPDKASTTIILPESISSAPCPDKASTITTLPESISSAPCPDKASTITLLPESILSLQELASSQKPRFPGSVRRREFLPPSIRESLSSLSTITSEGSASLKDEGDQVQIIRQPEKEDVDHTEGSVSGAQGPALAQPPERGLFAAVPPVEDPLESLPLQGALQVGGQDVWSMRAQRVRPAPTDSWMLESTVLTIPGQVELDPAEELPRRLQRDSLGPQPAHRVAPGAVPLSSWGAEGLPAFKGRYRVKVTPIASVGHSQSAEETPQSDTTEATVIMMPEGSELPDGAPKST